MVNSGDTKKMLIGEYTNKVVSGHRIVLPAQFRKQIGTSFIVTKGYDGCVLVVPKKSWSKLIEPMEVRSFLDRNVRDTLRFLVGSAFEANADSQGRIVVPESLRDYSTITHSEKTEKEVVFVGLLKWVEVWEKNKWETRSKNIERNADDIADKLISTEENKS